MRFDPSDLGERIAHELLATGVFRKWLFDDGPKKIDGTTFTFVLDPSGGHWATTHNLTVKDIIIGGGATGAVLSDLRPLCFATAFKILDMLVEWILEVPRHKQVTFQQKSSRVSSCSTSGFTPGMMDIFANTSLFDGFRELYCSTIDIRHAIVHRPYVAVSSGTNIEGPLGNGTRIQVTHDEQRSFVRFATLFGQTLSEQMQLRPYHKDQLLSDLYRLRNYHQQHRIQQLNVRVTRVTLQLPREFGGPPFTPLAIDLDELHTQKVMPIFAGEGHTRLHYDLEIRVPSDQGNRVWCFPEEHVPKGILDYAQLATKYSRFAVS